MLPLFGDERRREINLGGSSSVTTSQAAILNQARARRIERETVRKRQESAVTIQAWWRGITDARRVRQKIREQFTGDITGLTGLRCLVLIGQDIDFLDRWAAEVLSQGSLFGLAHGSDREHWLVLMRQVFFLLLRSVSDRPRSESTVSCLQVLCTLLNPASAIEALGFYGSQLTVNITEYAVRHDLYQYLARSIQIIGPETKNAPTLPFFVELIYRPLNTLERSSEAFLQCFQSLAIHILTIPLLPNRIPISSLTALSAKLPLSSLSVLSTSVADLVSTIPLQSHVHLIANLYAFTSPRYAILPLSSLKTYLQLMTASLSILPVHALDPPSPSDTRAPAMSWADDGDSESEQPQVVVVTSFAPTPRLPPLDARTQKRLQTLPSPSHLNALLKAAQHDRGALPDLVLWLVNLYTVWPTRKDKILSTLLLYGGGGLVREIYRDYVRNSPLGKDENMSSLMDPSLASAWPPLLLLTELYTQSLLTMGDDEFFSNSRTSAGIDGGGVFKEFFTSLCKEVFDTDRGLWLANKRNEIYPNPHSYATEPHNLNWYRFIGRILGKALYKGILVEVAFAGFFLAKWLDKQSFLDDLASLDPDLYQGLIFLKNYTGDVEDLALNFTVAIEEFGVAKAVDLIPDGSNVPVTRENRLQYIYLTSHYRLSKQIKLQSEAFFEGLSDMIDPKWLRMFNQQELQLLLGGVNAPVDVQDLRAHTQYGGLYDNDESTIQTFWKVLEDFDQEQRRLFLRFVTSCSRPPLLGFRQLSPLFAIRDAGSDEDRLPTSSTCVNLLKLPRYKSEKKLHDKLLQAISSGAGFDLS
ncbi:hypothetical protein BDR03DRAFT_999556 [Suillus americanus]|nr:hypothetical protein BDR03DRAFT_999556 [Suillus americanus]